MISSSNPPSAQGLDAMLIVHSLLDAHPASTTCEQFIRTTAAGCTTTSTLFEAKAILTKVYVVQEQGKGYQTQINAILKAHKEAHENVCGRESL